jgi:hypothetical protein
VKLLEHFWFSSNKKPALIFSGRIYRQASCEKVYAVFHLKDAASKNFHKTGIHFCWQM